MVILIRGLFKLANAKHFVDGLLDYCGIERDGVSDSEKMLLTIDAETAVFLALEGNLVHLSGVLDDGAGQQGFLFHPADGKFQECNRHGILPLRHRPGQPFVYHFLTINTDGLGQSEFIDYFRLFIENSEQWAAAMGRKAFDIPDGQEDAGSNQPDPSGILQRV